MDKHLDKSVTSRWNKMVFLFCRVHFLMSGGFCVNGEPLAGDGGDEPTLVLHMSRDKICFTKSSVLIRYRNHSL